MYKLADAMEAHADELAALETLDNGKPIWYSLARSLAHSLTHSLTPQPGWHVAYSPLECRVYQIFAQRRRSPLLSGSVLRAWALPPVTSSRAGLCFVARRCARWRVFLSTLQRTAANQHCPCTA